MTTVCHAWQVQKQKELHAMLLACFERDPAARPSATELRTAQTFMRGGAQ